MNATFNSIIFPIIFTIFPMIFMYYRGEKTTYLKSLIWPFLAAISSIVIFLVMKLDYNLIITLITLVLATLFNFLFINEWVNSKKLLKLLLVFGIFFFGSLFQFIPILLFNMDVNNISASENLYLTIFSDIIIVIIIYFLYRKEIKEQFINFKKNFYDHIDIAFKYWLIGLIVMVVSNLLIMALTPNAVANNEQQVQEMIKGSAPWASLICVGLFAPIIEELTFRKAFYDAFKKKWLFIIMSSFVFGGLHVFLSIENIWDLLYLIPYSSLGVAFAFTMSKTKNVFPSILVHVFHNTVLTVLSIVSSLTAMVISLW